MLLTPLNRKFLEHLKRFRSIWRRGFAFALVLRVAGWAASVVAVYFAADFFFALDEGVRIGLNSLLPLGLVLVAAPEAIRIARLGLAETANRLDQIGKHRRQEVLTAWELQRQSTTGAVATSSDALPEFLVQRSLGEAVARLEALTASAVRPHDLMIRFRRLLGVQIFFALAVIRLCGSDAFLTISARMLWPGRDIPPYSHYQFDVRPDVPAILYGGAAEVAVTIKGAPVTESVWMMTRRPGQKVQRVACFQEGGARYAQRLENVTAPVEFCFSVGRARSRWHSVDLQLQPQVVLAKVRLIPPAYTRLPVREFPAGQEELAGVRGTKVSLTLTSNRPLKEGIMTLASRATAKGAEQVISGRLVSERVVGFEWVLVDDALAKATLRDVRGTPTAEPLVVPQKLIPDEAPKVVLAEPPEFSMATPLAVIKVAGSVADDFGIEQIDWIRSVVGFNDRALTLRRGAVGPDTDFETELSLGVLGVEAGQVLEFYTEALDNNPWLSGVGASGVARVKVISEEEYAEIIRNREALEQFIARYALATESMKRVLESLDQLQGLVLWRNPDRVKLAEAVKKSLDAHTAAEAVFKQLAFDFAAYDSEKELKKSAGAILGQLAQNKVELEAMREPGPENTAKAEGMLKRLGAEAASLLRQGVSAELAAKVAQVLDGAARFQMIVQRQESLVRLLKQRYGSVVSAAELAFLGGYGEQQAEIAQELGGFAVDLRAAAEALPKEMAQLKWDSLGFIHTLEQSGASNHMGQAVSASRNSDGPRTYREAQLALEKLKGALQQPESQPQSDPPACSNSFARLCRGQPPDFGPDSLKKTLQEMFRSLCRKRGVGQGTGPGTGAGEGGEQGNAGGAGADGYSELGTPVYGPGRSQMSKAGQGQGQTGDGRGTGVGAGAAGQRAAVVERLSGSDSGKPAGEVIQFERLPVKYREAVKRYFMNGKEGGGR